MRKSGGLIHCCVCSGFLNLDVVTVGTVNSAAAMVQQFVEMVRLLRRLAFISPQDGTQPIQVSGNFFLFIGTAIENMAGAPFCFLKMITQKFARRKQGTKGSDN